MGDSGVVHLGRSDGRASYKNILGEYHIVNKQKSHYKSKLEVMPGWKSRVVIKAC